MLGDVMWVQRSGHFNLRDPSWRFVPCLVTLCSNTELPHQDEKDYSASVHSLTLVSLHLPLFHAPAPSISLNLPSYHCIFKNTSTRKHFILWKSLKSKKKEGKNPVAVRQIITEKLLIFPPDNEQCSSYTYSSHTIMACPFCWVYKAIQTPGDLIMSTEPKTLILMSFWKMKSVRTLTNEVTGVQNSNKTPWAVKLCFQTSAPSKWDR